ncbi:MAG: glycosyltransferase, partial [Proteobacteria bacterium]|nr:glycosyltransferase [Pseudomonadota bacterium]
MHIRELLSEDTELSECFDCSGLAAIQYLSRSTDFIIGNSQATLSQFSRKKEKRCVYNTFDETLLSIAAPEFRGPLKVGMISNNTNRKGVTDLVRLAIAAGGKDSLEFYLIGPRTSAIDSLREQLKEVAPHPKIYFIDYVNRTADAIRILDVVMSLSRVAESFGRTVVEGMAAARPVVAYSLGAMPEIVADGVNG